MYKFGYCNLALFCPLESCYNIISMVWHTDGQVLLGHYLRIVTVSRLMGEDIKVRSLANGRMEISHLNNGSNHPGVAQNL